MTSKKKYDELLTNFCGNRELIELLYECILDEEESREALYRATGAYPERRCLLMKLKYDLLEKREELTNGK